MDVSDDYFSGSGSDPTARSAFLGRIHGIYLELPRSKLSRFGNIADGDEVVEKGIFWGAFLFLADSQQGCQHVVAGKVV